MVITDSDYVNRMDGFYDGINDATNFRPNVPAEDTADTYKEGYAYGYQKIQTFVDMLSDRVRREMRQISKDMD